MKYDYYRAHEWTPELRQAGDKLIAKIHEVAPELEVLFMGAAALGLPGKKDLDILCDNRDIKRYVDTLTPILGAPQKLNSEMAVWNYMQSDIKIDCILSDSARPNSHIPKQKKVFELLKANPALRERYRQLKYECDGLPYGQYEAKKKAFLQELELM